MNLHTALSSGGLLLVQQPLTAAVLATGVLAVNAYSDHRWPRHPEA